MQGGGAGASGQSAGGGDTGTSGQSAGGEGAGPSAGRGGEGTSGASQADDTPPTVVETRPLDDSEAQATTAEVFVTFSEEMATESLAGSTFSLSLGAEEVPGVVTLVAETLIFAPDTELELGETYTAVVSTDAADLAGNRLQRAYSWSFSTDDKPRVGPAPVVLGAAGAYVILAKSAISNVPTSEISGDVGLSPAAASYVTGFSLTRAGIRWTSPQVNGGIFAANNDPPTPSKLTVAVGAMQAAYTDAAGRLTPDFLDLEGGELGGLTLEPGLYQWTSSVTTSADVTLQGAANDVWIFQIAGDLSMAADQRVTLSGGARPQNIFWQVAGAVDLGVDAHAEGIVLAKTRIGLAAGASINGRLLAQTAVDMDSSTVTAPKP
jgi:Ice-binding-like/Bacterial Ig-like domain